MIPRRGTLRTIAKQALLCAIAEQGLTMVEIIEKGVPEQTLYRAVKGANLSLDTLEKVLHATGYRIASLKIEPL